MYLNLFYVNLSVCDLKCGWNETNCQEGRFRDLLPSQHTSICILYFTLHMPLFLVFVLFAFSFGVSVEVALISEILF